MLGATPIGLCPFTISYQINVISLSTKNLELQMNMMQIRRRLSTCAYDSDLQSFRPFSHTQTTPELVPALVLIIGVTVTITVKLGFYKCIVINIWVLLSTEIISLGCFIPEQVLKWYLIHPLLLSDNLYSNGNFHALEKYIEYHFELFNYFRMSALHEYDYFCFSSK